MIKSGRSRLCWALAQSRNDRRCPRILFWCISLFSRCFSLRTNINKTFRNSKLIGQYVCNVGSVAIRNMAVWVLILSEIWQLDRWFLSEIWQFVGKTYCILQHIKDLQSLWYQPISPYISLQLSAFADGCFLFSGKPDLDRPIYGHTTLSDRSGLQYIKTGLWA